MDSQAPHFVFQISSSDLRVPTYPQRIITYYLTRRTYVCVYVVICIDEMSGFKVVTKFSSELI